MPPLKILYINSPKYDITTALHIEGLLKVAGLELRFTTLGNYAPAEKVLNKWDAIDFGNEEADVVILGSRPYVDLDIFRQVIKKGLTRVMMEGGDESALSTRALEFYKFDWIFKRELYQTEWRFRSLHYSLLPGSDAGLWNVLKAHKIIPFPFYHSLGNPASVPAQVRNLARNLFWFYGRERVKPFPFGIEDRMQGKFNPDPEYDLCCIMRPHIPARNQIIELLKQKAYPRMFLGMIPPSEEDIQWMVERGACHPEAVRIGGSGFAQNKAYYLQLNNSRASISIPGGGFDTLRFWEILGQGSLLISKRIAIKMPYPLQEGEHYVAFDTLDELKDIIEWLYSNPEEADRIRRQGYEYAIKHHTSFARAQYFLDSIRTNL